MSKHTPEPWRLAEAVEGKHTKTNLRRIRSEREGLDHGAVCEVYGIADGSEAHANALLIASAPELLAALQSLMQHPHIAAYLPYAPNDKVMQAARDAINKATGAQQ